MKTENKEMYKYFLVDDLLPSSLMQAFTHILWLQFNQKSMPADLLSSLTLNIERLGGLSSIELWLKENDPGHSTPSSFTDMNWTWLREDLRMPKP